MRLSSYYQLGCDYGTAVMISWENGGIAPIYLCESHAAQLGWSGKSGEGVLAVTPPLIGSNDLAEPPKSTVASGPAADAQVGLEEEYLADVKVPVSDLTPGNSAKVLMDDAVENMAREDFEAHGTVLQRVKPTATEEKQAKSANLERFCVSRYGERCAWEATVHCPKCGRWFCDAHAEDGKWHLCGLKI